MKMKEVEIDVRKLGKCAEMLESEGKKLTLTHIPLPTPPRSETNEARKKCR